MNNVIKTRRNFLAGLASAAAAGATLSSSLHGQVPGTVSPKKSPTDEPPPDNPNMPSPQKLALEQNEKEIKKKVEQLYDLATELKAEVDKTDSSKVLSLAMVKKAEEIEKLAREIKSRSKG